MKYYVEELGETFTSLKKAEQAILDWSGDSEVVSWGHHEEYEGEDKIVYCYYVGIPREHLSRINNYVIIKRR